MIDARTFATSFNAFWHDHAPTCEYFVRRINQEWSERPFIPLPKARIGNSAAIAEFAFNLFVERHRKEAVADVVAAATLEQRAWNAVVRTLTPYNRRGALLPNRLDNASKSEARTLFSRIELYITPFEGELTCNPIFQGCGFIDKSKGDVICGDTLIEIKTVDRAFRSTDLRQAITYAGLDFASNQRRIRGIALFNPRMGFTFRETVDEICIGIAGMSAEEFFSDLVEFVSNAGMSR